MLFDTSTRVGKGTIFIDTVKISVSVICPATNTLLSQFCFDHYANMSVQYTAIFHGCKNDNFQMKILIFFLFLLKT